MDEGNLDEDVYSEEGTEKLLENDEISPKEAAFMEGEENPDSVVCAYCKKPLGDNKKEIVEVEIDEVIHKFCSEKCAEKGTKELTE